MEKDAIRKPVAINSKQAIVEKTADDSDLLIRNASF
jgi:hypothetical protein